MESFINEIYLVSGAGLPADTFGILHSSQLVLEPQKLTVEFVSCKFGSCLSLCTLDIRRATVIPYMMV